MLKIENNTTTARTAVNAVRYMVKGRDGWLAFVREYNITRDDVADASRTLASLAFPNEEPVQKRDGVRTVYGNAVQAAAYNIRTALATIEGDDDTDETEDKPVNLLTRAGLKADLEDVIAAWRAAHEAN